MTKVSKALLIISSTLLIFVGCRQNSGTKQAENIVKLNCSGNYTISQGGTYDVSGKLTDGKLKVEADSDVVLILSGVEINNSTDEAIKIQNKGLTTIKSADGSKNVITGSGDAAINAKSAIAFDGNGTLEITGTAKHGVECDTDITVNSGSINISSYEHGLKSKSIIKILGGTLNINAKTGKGIKAEKEYIGEDGTITIVSPNNEGLESKGALTINGGNYNITAGEDGINAGTSEAAGDDITNKGTDNMPEANNNFRPGGEKAMNNERPEMPEGFSPPDRFETPPEGLTPPDGVEAPPQDFTPHGGSEIPPSDFVVPEGATTSGRGIPFEHERQKGGFGGMGMGMGMANENSIVTINGGHIKINCTGDGIDSNGSLTINGGTIIIDGPENSGNGPLDCDGQMIINGGTVLTASSRGMTQMPQSMSQGFINVSFTTPLSKGDEILIKDSANNTVTEHTVERICEMLIYTSPEISNGGEYRMYINGNEHSTVTATDNAGSNQGFGRGGRF